MSVTLSAHGNNPGGKHVLKMASSVDSVEERRRLQRRVRTQRYRDRQNEDARAQRRQSDRDRRSAACQRATEAPLKKGLFVLQCTLTESFHAVCCCACVLFFDRATRLSRLLLRTASNRAQETSEQTYIMIVVYATIHYAIQLLLYRENRRSDLRQRAALRRAQETSEQTYIMIVVYAAIHYAIQLLLYRENRRSDLQQRAALRRAQETPEQT